jgi:hypothetical protein
MKQADRDLLLQRQVATGERNIELLERQVEASEDQARISQNLADALAAPERRLRRREQDAAFPALRPLFGGQRGAVGLLRNIPGFSGLWTRIVPSKYLESVLDRSGDEWWLVSCTCNERPLVQTGGLADCLCGRWFFATGSSVRVRRFPVSCSDE